MHMEEQEKGLSMKDKHIKQFVKDRDAALLSLDKDKIVAYLNKYNIPIPDNETVFWAGIHKCIVAINAAPAEKKIDSMMWLIQHGFSPDIK